RGFDRSPRRRVLEALRVFGRALRGGYAALSRGADQSGARPRRQESLAAHYPRTEELEIADAARGYRACRGGGQGSPPLTGLPACLRQLAARRSRPGRKDPGFVCHGTALPRGGVARVLEGHLPTTTPVGPGRHRGEYNSLGRKTGRVKCNPGR